MEACQTQLFPLLRPGCALVASNRHTCFLLSQLALDVEGPWGSFMHLRTCSCCQAVSFPSAEHCVLVAISKRRDRSVAVVVADSRVCISQCCSLESYIVRYPKVALICWLFQTAGSSRIHHCNQHCTCVYKHCTFAMNPYSVILCMHGLHVALCAQ